MIGLFLDDSISSNRERAVSGHKHLVLETSIFTLIESLCPN